MMLDRSKPFGVVYGGEFAGCLDQGGNLYHPDGRMVAGETEAPKPVTERKQRAPKPVETPAEAQIDAQLNG